MAKKSARMLKPSRIRDANGNRVMRATKQALRRMDKAPFLAAIEQDAGFIIPAGQKPGERCGYQVFVKVAAFSEVLLMDDPMTGGLLANKSAKKRRMK